MDGESYKNVIWRSGHTSLHLVQRRANSQPPDWRDAKGSPGAYFPGLPIL